MHEIQVKTILSSKYGMNLYRGCTHGCIYCDSRSACYGMDHDFEDIAVKANALELLESALSKLRHPRMIGTGSMCDPYMHCEAKRAVTRAALECILSHGCGVSVITKSDLILRDVDLYEKINRRAKAVVNVTLTTADEDLCRKIEPHVATTARRVEVLKEFAARGIPTVVWLTPILPFINDTVENLDALLDACLDAKVTGILSFGFGVTLREGNRAYFYQKLDELFPGVKEKYIAAFGDAYACISPNNAQLCNRFRTRLLGRKILTEPKEIFDYLAEFPEKSDQISFFD